MKNHIRLGYIAWTVVIPQQGKSLVTAAPDATNTGKRGKRQKVKQKICC